MKKNIKERICKNKKCGRIYFDDSKSKYCPKCRQKRDSDMAKGAVGVIAIASTVFGVIKVIKKK